MAENSFFPLRNRNFSPKKGLLTIRAVALLAEPPANNRAGAAVETGKAGDREQCIPLLVPNAAKKLSFLFSLPARNPSTVRIVSNPVAVITGRSSEPSPRGRLFDSYLLPQHFLYFLPLPQGQGSLRPTCCSFLTGFLGPSSWYLFSTTFWGPVLCSTTRTRKINRVTSS